MGTPELRSVQVRVPREGASGRGLQSEGAERGVNKVGDGGTWFGRWSWWERACVWGRARTLSRSGASGASIQQLVPEEARGVLGSGSLGGRCALGEGAPYGVCGESRVIWGEICLEIGRAHV